MADIKISDLTAATTPLGGTEVLPIVQSGVTVKVAVSNLTAGRSVSATAVAITGSTSGTATIVTPAVAGTPTITLPIVTGTLATLAGTETLTNKTLTGAVMNGTVGATTPAAGAFTTGTFSSTLAVTGITTVAAGTALLPAIVSTTGTADTGLWFPAADTVAASTAGVERLRIDSTGNVGIGLAANASVKLQVAAATDITLGIANATTITGAVTLEAINNARSVNIPMEFRATKFDFTGPTTGMSIATTGNVGIGTASPAALLHVSNGDAKVRIGLTASSQYTDIYRDSGTGYTIYNAAQAPSFRSHIWQLGGTEAARIDSSGNVEIGITTAAPAKFTVSGQGGSNVWVQNNINTGTSAIVSLGFSNDNGLVGYVQTSGSATSYVTSSDYRLKQHIQPMIGALAKVAQLKPVTYKWKVDGSNGQGFIAHELQEVVPDCVSGEKDATREEEYEVIPAVPAVVDAEGVETTPAVQAVKGTRIVPSYQGVDTSFLVATLTAAIQELKAIIDTQATRITALENK